MGAKRASPFGNTTHQPSHAGQPPPKDAPRVGDPAPRSGPTSPKASAIPKPNHRQESLGAPRNPRDTTDDTPTQATHPYESNQLTSTRRPPLRGKPSLPLKPPPPPTLLVVARSLFPGSQPSHSLPRSPGSRRLLPCWRWRVWVGGAGVAHLVVGWGFRGGALALFGCGCSWGLLVFRGARAAASLVGGFTRGALLWCLVLEGGPVSKNPLPTRPLPPVGFV